MSKVQKEKATKESQGYLCFVYGGCMKSGWIRYFSCNQSPEEEYDKYKNHYGTDIKGRYVKVSNATDTYSKLRTELMNNKIKNTYGDIYEIGVLAAVNYMKEVAGVKKASTWGGDVEEEDEGSKTDNAQKTKSKGGTKGKKKPDAQEIEGEDEDNDVHVETTDVDVPKKGTKGTKTNKQKTSEHEQSVQDTQTTETHTSEVHATDTQTTDAQAGTTGAKEVKHTKKSKAK